MVYFQTNFGKFWTALEWKMLVYFMTPWNILGPFVIIYDCLVFLMVIWYIFSRFDMFGSTQILTTLSNATKSDNQPKKKA
jgi:hypothetical protein